MNSTEDRKELQIKWYLKPLAVIAAILFAGPLALPLLWLSPAFKKSHKIVITIIITLLTIWIVIASIELCNILLQRMTELQRLMG